MNLDNLSNIELIQLKTDLKKQYDVANNRQMAIKILR